MLFEPMASGWRHAIASSFATRLVENFEYFSRVRTSIAAFGWVGLQIRVGPSAVCLAFARGDPTRLGFALARTRVLGFVVTRCDVSVHVPRELAVWP